MCEWLTCSEWCDVQLQCGGRAFSAHRAVLASVSTFLRRILLSCPLEESPTFIVLPDFDLEAMSAVLYYIYNGEVVIQKQKLEMFLEIIKAMQIFIDHKYLSKILDSVQNANFNLNIYCKSKSSKNVFTLKSSNSKDQQYIKIKKGEQIQNVLLQCSFDNLDFSDKQMLSQNWSLQHAPSLGNLQSPYEDRQRNSFLRDSFIETYPRNGNANGLTAGVPAISNERYRGSTSVLLTNANGKYPRADDELSATSKKTTEHSSNLLTALYPRKELQHSQINELTHGRHPNILSDSTQVKNLNSTEFNMKLFIENCSITNSNFKDTWINYLPLQPSSPIFPIGLQMSDQIVTEKHTPSTVDLRITQSVSNSVFPTQFFNTNKSLAIVKSFETFKSFETNPHSDKCNVEGNRYINTTRSVTKTAIFNQVLESPWCPRLPNNYRPFRRKIQNTIANSGIGGNEIHSINDNNNNIQKSNVSSNTIKESSNSSYSITSFVVKDDFKCSICNQVLASADSLTAHVRRHSSAARYTCGECGKTFSQLRNFKYHMSVHRGTREFAATCTVCGKYFNDRGYLSSHMKIHRNRKEYKCSQCPKSFNQRVAYNMHVRIHTGVKPHVCDQCGKAFSRKMLLKQHQRTHSGERPYACPHCDKRFADRSNMTLHLRLHSGIKPFSCSLCPKSFTKKHHLKSHLNFHTGAKPYSCPRCKLAFTQSSNMRTHLKKCTAPETPVMHK